MKELSCHGYSIWDDGKTDTVRESNVGEGSFRSKKGSVITRLQLNTIMSYMATTIMKKMT